MSATHDCALATFRVPEPTWKKVVRECAREAGATLHDLVTNNKVKHISRARQKAMYVMHTDLKMSYSAIGRKLGHRDHTSARWGVLAHKARIAAGNTSPLPEIDPRYLVICKRRRLGERLMDIAADIGISPVTASSICRLGEKHAAIHRAARSLQ